MESSRNTVIRSLHAVGAAGWFGGSLMGEAWGGPGLLIDIAELAVPGPDA